MQWWQESFKDLIYLFTSTVIAGKYQLKSRYNCSCMHRIIIEINKEMGTSLENKVTEGFSGLHDNVKTLFPGLQILYITQLGKHGVCG